ncbi:MAG: hydrogenase maturation peptidase HycI, partial [Synergistaceae bacterium]|nr:hydrogenase maturation peptidase HycI [Synergistaceae bacterium]
MTETVLWCVGSSIMADDGAGPALFRALSDDPARHILPVNCETTPENYVGPLVKDPPGRLVVV